MTQATDKELALLHKQVAKSMTHALERGDKAEGLLVRMKTTDWDDPEDVGTFKEKLEAFLEECTEVNPALLQAVTKFLKDNSITCAVEDSAELSDLQKTIAAKRSKRKTVGNVEHI